MMDYNTTGDYGKVSISKIECNHCKTLENTAKYDNIKYLWNISKINCSPCRVIGDNQIVFKMISITAHVNLSNYAIFISLEKVKARHIASFIQILLKSKLYTPYDPIPRHGWILFSLHCYHYLKKCKHLLST